MSYRRGLLNPTRADSRTLARNDMAYADTIRGEDEKRKRDLAMREIGQPANMSRVDQEAAAGGSTLGGGLLPGQTNASPRARLTSPVSSVNVSRSPVPLNVNTPDAQQNAAILASPPPVTPSRAANQTGNAIDQNAIAARRQMASPVASAQPAAPAGGRTISNDAGVAAGLTPLVGPNGFGTGSVRTAQKGEALTPATTTADGVQRAAPFDAEAARAALYAKHPAIFNRDEHGNEINPTPENAAFQAHVNDQIKKGMTPEAALQSGHDNADSIVARVNQLQNKGDQTALNPSMGKNGITLNADTAIPSGLRTDNTQLPPPPSAATTAGRAVGNALGTAGQVGSSLANAPRTAANALDRGISDFASGVTGQTQDLHPIANTSRAVKNFVSGAANSIAGGVSGALGPAVVGGMSGALSSPETTTADQELKKKKLKNPTL